MQHPPSMDSSSNADREEELGAVGGADDTTRRTSRSCGSDPDAEIYVSDVESDRDHDESGIDLGATRNTDQVQIVRIIHHYHHQHCPGQDCETARAEARRPATESVDPAISATAIRNRAQVRILGNTYASLADSVESLRANQVTLAGQINAVRQRESANAAHRRNQTEPSRPTYVRADYADDPGSTWREGLRFRRLPLGAPATGWEPIHVEIDSPLRRFRDAARLGHRRRVPPTPSPPRRGSPPSPRQGSPPPPRRGSPPSSRRGASPPPPLEQISPVRGPSCQTQERNQRSAADLSTESTTWLLVTQVIRLRVVLPNGTAQQAWDNHVADLIEAGRYDSQQEVERAWRFAFSTAPRTQFAALWELTVEQLLAMRPSAGEAAAIHRN